MEDNGGSYRRRSDRQRTGRAWRRYRVRTAGAQIYGLFDAFQQAQLKVIGARHEQACGYMAYGYARSTGRPGVFSVVPGPGVLNAGAALLTAFGANEPCCA